MIELDMPQDVEEWAKRELQEQRAHLQDYFPPRPRDTRWVGRAAEHVIDGEMTRLGLEHVWNGGVDAKPDFEFSGLGMACKCNVGTFKPDFGFTIPAPLFRKMPAMALFSCYEPHRRKLVLAGVASLNTLRRAATFRPTGSPGFRGPTPYSCYVITADKLKPWEEFVAWAQGLTQEGAS